jgi:hypothetical protein
MRRQEQAALEAVARHFSATWEKGGEPPDAYLTMAGKRIAVAVTSIDERRAGRDGLTRPRLRFDKVALRFVEGLRAALDGAVPDGTAVIVTITAPIRLPAKTAATLEERVRASLARRSAPAEVTDTILGNQIRVRVLQGVSERISKVIGFVHNPDSDPDGLVRVTQSLLRHVDAAAGKRAPHGFTGDRWLVLAHEDGHAPLKTYRRAYAQLAMRTDFKKILMVLASGRVENLAAQE